MKILHENDFGRSCKCECCQEIQLCLGSVIMTLSEAEYLRFDNFFDEIRKDFATESPTQKTQKKYVIVTNFKGIVLSLSYQELHNTIELLNFSTLMLSVNKLTSLSEK